MQDVYAWIDPFEEIEKARQWGTYQREEGRREVLKFVSDNNTGEFNRHLTQALQIVARKFARDYIAPMMRENYSPYMNYQKLEDERADQMFAVSAPFMMEANLNGELRLMKTDLGRQGESGLLLSFKIAQPYQYNVAMMPDWRR